MSNDLKTQVDELVREAINDPRSTHELISLALSELDEDAAWEPVTILHRRGTREIFDAARSLVVSSCAVERTLGANILGQLGIPNHRFPRESVELLLDFFQTESDESVLAATCVALGHILDPLAIPALVRLSSHPSENVRYAVVYGLMGHSDELAIATLIKLSADTDEDVRDWATFGLGSQINDDTPAIREALIRRVTDADSVVRGEALVGLARRHDERVVEPLIHELTRWEPSELGYLPIEAAVELADQRLLPTLQRLKQTVGDDDGRFDHAIEQCSRS